jgi:hypothetical protein
VLQILGRGPEEKLIAAIADLALIRRDHRFTVRPMAKPFFTLLLAGALACTATPVWASQRG